MILENATSAAPRKRGQAPATRAEDRDRVPVEIPRDRWDRPLILPEGVTPLAIPLDADPGYRSQLEPYTRASTLGEAIEDHRRIERRSLRYLAAGLGRSRALWLTAKAAADPEDEQGRKVLDQVAKDALRLAGAHEAADYGTAVHALAARQAQGWVIEPSEVEEDAAALAAIADVMRRFEVLAIETFVVNDELRAAGTFDYLVRLLVDLPAPDGSIIPAGTVVVLDLKTSRTSRYFGPKFAAQLYAYATGALYDPATGQRGALPCDRRWALLLHAPAGGAMAQLHVVDLREGAEDARVAQLIRERRRARARFALIEDLPEPGADLAPCRGIAV